MEEEGEKGAVFCLLSREMSFESVARKFVRPPLPILHIIISVFQPYHFDMSFLSTDYDFRYQAEGKGQKPDP